MKKQFIYLFLALIFSIGTVTVGQAGLLMGDTGETAIIYPKSGGQGLAFFVPQKYLDKEGNLNTPIKVMVSSDKNLMYSKVSKSLSIELPSLKVSGECYVTIQIGNYVETKVLIL